MAHRGRLNVLSNVMGKPYRAIFHEFAGGATNPADVGGSGDVKYHLGTSSDREFDGICVHLSLLPNPVAPGGGRPGRARQGARDQTSRATRKARCFRCCSTAMPRSPARGSSPNASDFPGCRATAPAARSISSSTTRSASPPPAVRALLALSVRHRQVGPGADPSRQRRRSGGGDLLLQAGDRISPDVQPRHRHRHVVLSPVRPQ
jgi:hypothetical protein